MFPFRSVGEKKYFGGKPPAGKAAKSSKYDDPCHCQCSMEFTVQCNYSVCTAPVINLRTPYCLAGK